MEKITLNASDNTKIVADYRSLEHQDDKTLGWVVFVHMMPATKESWADLSQKLQNYGYQSIAIDLRGHGESEGGLDGYQSFSDEEHQKSLLDLDAAVKFLLERGATSEKIIFIGASIGANLSLQYIVQHSLDKLGTKPEFKTAVLLSPGVNYKGIETESLVKQLKADQKVFMIGARDDEGSLGNMADQINKISDSTPPDTYKEIKIYDNGGHGTDILKNHPDVVQLIIKFINNP